MNNKKQEEPKPIHEQIIDAVGGEDRFREIAGLKPKQETLEEAAESYADFSNDYVPICFGDKFNPTSKADFIAGAKWMQEQMEKIKEFDTWKEWKNS